MSLAAQIESVQPDVFYKLCSEPYFTPISIFCLREKRIDSEVNKALAGAAALSQSGVKYSRRGTAIGATIEVLMPMLKNAMPDTPGPVATLEQAFIVKEQPTMNLGIAGTGRTAEEIAVNIAQTFQLFCLGAQLMGFYTAPIFYNYVAPEKADDPFLMVKVVLNATFSLTALDRMLQPTLTAPGLDVALADNNIGGNSVMFYTTDGSMPGPGNPCAQIFSAPFAVASGTTVRCAAYSGTVNNNAFIPLATGPQGSMVGTYIVS